ncbi:MAG: hypothetical protein GY711_34900 [bacterium]|nr:hypothetical protein [bacterium]
MSARPESSRARAHPLRLVRGSPSPFALTIVELAGELEAHDTPWAVLRGADAFPEVPDGSDIDVLLGRDSVDAFEASLRAACTRTGARLHARDRIGPLRQYHLVRQAASGGHAFLTLDVHTAEACFGVPYLTLDDLPRPHCAAHGLPVLARPASVVLNLLPAVLAGAAPRPEYARDLRTADRVQVTQLLTNLVGAKCARDLVGTRAARTQPLGSCRRRLLARCFARRPLRSLLGWLHFGWALRVAPLVRPRGMFVVFLGTDGSGKSTLLDAVRSSLEPAFRGASVKTFHLRPGLLPQLDRIVHLGRATYDASDCASPHRAQPSGRLVSNLRVLYYALDYWIGYALRVLPGRRRNALVLFDRWFLDYLVDPERFRVRHGTVAARLISRLVPRADAVIVCTAPADVVQARKPELAPEESARQVAAYEALARERGFHVVSTDQPLAAARGAVLEALFPSPREEPPS